MKKQLQSVEINPNAGYTIMEGLVAMIMVAFLMSAVAPVIALSVGTRVQARRVELAVQAAKSYIDWVRTDPEGNAPPFTSNSFDSLPVPTGGSLNCPNDGDYCATADLYCVDGGDGGGCTVDSLTDMIVQAASFNNSPQFFTGGAANYDMSYQLAVRVYRANAFAPGVGTLEPIPAGTNVTNAVGSRNSPLVFLSTEVSPAELQGSFQNICNRIDPTGATCP